MPVADVLALWGVVATRRQLIAGTPHVEVDHAHAAGEVIVLACGRYAAPDAGSALRDAHEMSALLSLRHAALHWGWAVKVIPDRPDVTAPRNRRLSVSQSARVSVHRATFHAGDVSAGVTSQEHTLVDCLRTLPEDEALAIADSALREGFLAGRLASLVRDARGPGARQAR